MIVSTAINLVVMSEKVNVHLHDYGVMQVVIWIHWHRNKRADEMQLLENVFLMREFMSSCRVISVPILHFV